MHRPGNQGFDTMITDRVEWKGDNLVLNGRKTPLVSIVEDDKYREMWRVRRPDGSLTDMVNRARAKDAALRLAERLIDPSKYHPRSQPRVRTDV
jgi:hypothetical protein